MEQYIISLQDYGEERRRTVKYHLDRLKTLLLPTNVPISIFSLILLSLPRLCEYPGMTTKKRILPQSSQSAIILQIFKTYLRMRSFRTP